MRIYYALHTTPIDRPIDVHCSFTVNNWLLISNSIQNPKHKCRDMIIINSSIIFRLIIDNRHWQVLNGLALKQFPLSNKSFCLYGQFHSFKYQSFDLKCKNSEWSMFKIEMKLHMQCAIWKSARTKDRQPKGNRINLFKLFSFCLFIAFFSVLLIECIRLAMWRKWKCGFYTSQYKHMLIAPCNSFLM